MTTPKQILNSHLPSAAMPVGRDRGPYPAHCAVNDGYRGWILLLIIMVALGGAALVFAQGPQYQVTNLDSLGGTNSRGNSINDRSWVAGYSNLAGNQSRHAALWAKGDTSIQDLGTLGGPNSSVTWSVKSNSGIIAGIAQTGTPDPLGEAWSSAAFYPGPNNVGYINLGFVWDKGQMKALPTLGGNNGFATGANSRGQVVGWAENTCHDPTCVPPQVLQFRPVVWDAKNNNQVGEFPLTSGDTSGAATSINEKGEAVGISGICDQAVGRYTAKHAVLWDKKGGVTDLGNLGAQWWNTPTSINQRGDIVGFAGDPAYPDGDYLHAFIWTKKDGIKPLGALPGHVHSEAYGINERDQVVGVSCDANFVDCRAFIWDNGIMKDLNSLKPSNYTNRLEQAKDINDRGEITGRTINPSTFERRAFLAVPK
jgi:probable HAF family extracellular repeat protein